MGCDAHPYIEVKGRNGRWGLREDKERYWTRMEKEDLNFEQLDKIRPKPIIVLGSRNYRLFAALADVRNHGDYVDSPLFPRRGVPVDVSKATQKILVANDGDYHGHTFFTLRELMDAPWDTASCKMEYALLADEYLHWKKTGEVPDSTGEAEYSRHMFGSGDPDRFHRAVSEDEMLLLLAANGPKDLVKKFTPAWQHNGVKKVRGGPFVRLYLPISFKRLVPDLHAIIPHLAEMGAPEKVRVIIAFDN